MKLFIDPVEMQAIYQESPTGCAISWTRGPTD